MIPPHLYRTLMMAQTHPNYHVPDGWFITARLKIKTEFRRSRNKGRNQSRVKQRNSLCQRHELYVDFKTVEWHQWIVAPVGYKAYVCEVIIESRFQPDLLTFLLT